jgi:IMP dehydrogenase/GMP reductase
VVDMGDVVKSVFRQRKYEELYYLSYGYRTSYHREANILAKKNTDKLLSDEIIGVYDIEIPMLDIGDKFFLEDIEKAVTIKNRMRGSDGSTIYYVEDEMVETEDTKRTLAECEENILSFKQKDSEYARLNEEFNNLNKEFEKYKSEYKYKNKYFNFG